MTKMTTSEAAAKAASEIRFYPIQKGPSVPWEVMAPHESRCQANHSQSIQRIAERGGFAPSEAWAIVNNLEWKEIEKIGFDEAERLWIQYAERMNLHYAELETLRAATAQERERVQCLEGQVKAASELISGIQDKCKNCNGSGRDHDGETWLDTSCPDCQWAFDVLALLNQKATPDCGPVPPPANPEMRSAESWCAELFQNYGPNDLAQIHAVQDDARRGLFTREQLTPLLSVFGLAQFWTLRCVLMCLAKWCEHLAKVHSCDCLGYEICSACVIRANGYAAEIDKALDHARKIGLGE